MRELLRILVGALVGGSAALALGWLALGWLGARLRQAERWPAALAVGAPLLALLVAGMARFHLVRRGGLLALALSLVALAVWQRKRLPAAEGARLNRWARLSLCVVLVLFGVFTLRSAAAPDTTLPGEDDALVAAKDMAAGAGVPHWDAGPLWLAAFTFGRHSSAALFHCLFLFGLTLAVLAAVRRVAGDWEAVGAAVLLFCCPSLRVYAADAGTQVLFCFALFAALWFVALAWWAGQARLLLAALLLAAFAWQLAPAGGTAFPGFVFFWLKWAWPIPLLCVLIGWAARRQQLWLGVLVGFQVATAWPNVTPLLAASGARVPERAKGSEILRQSSPADFLAAHLLGYAEALLVDSATPARARVYSDTAVARAYTARAVDSSALLGDILHTAYDPQLLPARRRHIPLSDWPRRRFLIERGGRISEVRFFLHGVEVPRSSAWRVRSLEGEPRASLAFDNSDVTACDCALEVDFGAEIQFDEVFVYGTSGRPVAVPAGLRRQAIVALKRRGITHILAADIGALGGELARNARYWGVTEVGASHAAHVYQLD